MQLQPDPFFDEAGAPPPQTPQHLPAGYRPLYTDATHDGKPLTAVMRPSQSGLQGVIIPRAGMDGAPEGFNPHDISQMVVTFDPHIRGQSCTVRLGDIKAEDVLAAAQAVEGLVPRPTSLPTRRLHGAAVMHVVADRMNHNGHGNGHASDFGMVPVPQAPQEKWANHPASPGGYQPPQVPGGGFHPTHPPQPFVQPQQPPRRVQTLGAFGQPSQPQQQPPVPVQGFATPAPQVVDHPTIKVYFEQTYKGVTEAYYHDVYIDPQGKFAALMYADAYRGYKYFPYTGELAGGDMAMAIAGTVEVYQIQPLDVRFTHNGVEYGLVKIVNVVHGETVFA